MTSTLTRPREAAPVDGDAAAGASTRRPGSWFSTGDHKRLGLLFIYGGVAALVAACISALLFFVLNGEPNVWTHSTSRLASITTAVALVIGIPALWIGLTTYVVPLQVGATRLALPRLHNLALWTYAVGGALVTVGFLADDRPIRSLASSIPSGARGDGSSPGVTELIIVGLFLVALALLLAAVSVLTTILNRRADGLRLVHLPLFSWSALATSSVAVLATPVFLAGLALLYYDHHYGSTLFGGGAAARRIWAHQLWVVGHPFGLLFAAAAVGIFCDVVATHARRPLVGFAAARVAAAAAPVLTLLLWAGNVSVLRSPFGPVATIGGIVVAAPLVLALLTWASTLKEAASTEPGPRFHPSLVFVVLFLLDLGLVALLSIVAVLVGVEGSDAEAFRNGQISMLTFGAPLLGLGAAATHWSPKLWGRVSPSGPALLQAVLLFVGPVLVALPGYLVGFGAGDGVAPIGAAGAALTAAGVVLFLVGLTARNASTEADPYGGHTLEWAAASPPPPHNFDTIPDIRSPHPLTDARGTA